MADWYVGQRVICVNNGFLDISDAPELVEGAIYTVVAVLPRRRGFYGLRLREAAANEKFQAFDERRFRPLAESARNLRPAYHRDGSAVLSRGRESER